MKRRHWKLILSTEDNSCLKRKCFELLTKRIKNGDCEVKYECVTPWSIPWVLNFTYGLKKTQEQQQRANSQPTESSRGLCFYAILFQCCSKVFSKINPVIDWQGILIILAEEHQRMRYKNIPRKVFPLAMLKPSEQVSPFWLGICLLNCLLRKQDCSCRSLVVCFTPLSSCFMDVLQEPCNPLHDSWQSQLQKFIGIFSQR